jgi:acetyl esterase/lipase
MKKFLIALVSLIALNATAQICFPGRFTETPLFDSADIRKDSNIVFATTKNYFSGAILNLQMDVYYPASAVDTMTDRPFILLIHGGAFLAGSRRDMAYECMEYARRGFVVGTIDYRLGWNCAATDLLGVCFFCQGNNYDLQTATYAAAQDARAALRYVNANCATWNADANRIFIGGESAGAITAYHAAFWDQAEASAFCPWAVNAVGTLDTAGNSLPSTWSVKGLIDHCGAIADDSSLLNNGNIPVISFHDQFDCVVPYGTGQVISCLCQPFYYASGSQVVNSRLTAQGTCTELNTVVNSANHCSYPKQSIIKRSSCFLKRILCNSCVSATNTNIWAVDSCDNVMMGISYFGVNPVSISAVPNPASEFCAFRFSEPTRSSGVIRIYDVTGRLIGTQAYIPMTTEVRVEISALAEGIYFAETELAGQAVKTQFSVVR